MQSLETDPLELLLWATAIALAAANSFVVLWQARSRARTGPVVHAVLRRRGARMALLAGVGLVALLVALAGESTIRIWPALAVLALAALLLARSPSFRDSVLGDGGVQLGWHARRFEELEEWRLVGEHLRWKLFGTWVACDAPAMLHANLRAKLGQLCPERETRFKG